MTSCSSSRPLVTAAHNLGGASPRREVLQQSTLASHFKRAVRTCLPAGDSKLTIRCLEVRSGVLLCSTWNHV